VPIKSALIVNRKSLYRIYVQEHHDRDVQQALNRRDPAALAIKHSHQSNERTLDRLQALLTRRGISAVVRWRGLTRSTRKFDLVLSVGGDGTLLDTSHHILGNTPLLGVNSDPERSVGALCAGTVEDVPWLLDQLEEGSLRPRELTRIRVRVEQEEVLGPTLNDVLFAHVSPAGLTRYDLALRPADQPLPRKGALAAGGAASHRGSGLWVATPAGSTAAIRSAGGRRMPLGSRRLQFVAREPYVAPDGAPPPLLRGFVRPEQALVVVCRLRRGSVWADGVHRSRAVSYGQRIIFDRHPEPLRLVHPGESAR
jgi:NAD+ kinase